MIIAMVFMTMTVAAAKHNRYQRFCDRYCSYECSVLEPAVEPSIEDLQLIASDTNRDGIVNIFDLARIGLSYGTGDPLALIVADVNHDAVVDDLDLQIVGDNFGKTTIWQNW
jgi:hypothetical protein